MMSGFRDFWLMKDLNLHILMVEEIWGIKKLGDECGNKLAYSVIFFQKVIAAKLLSGCKSFLKSNLGMFGL